jgi:hypothetical protein
MELSKLSAFVEKRIAYLKILVPIGIIILLNVFLITKI